MLESESLLVLLMRFFFILYIYLTDDCIGVTGVGSLVPCIFIMFIEWTFWHWNGNDKHLRIG